MQDKPVHIDDKFTNKAWADMSSLLDRDLPVQNKKRRRFIGWWWLGLLGIIAGAGVVFFSLNKKTERNLPYSGPIANAKTTTPADIKSPAKFDTEFNGNNLLSSNSRQAKNREIIDEQTAKKTTLRKKATSYPLKKEEHLTANNLAVQSKINSEFSQIEANKTTISQAKVVEEDGIKRAVVDANILDLVSIKPLNHLSTNSLNVSEIETKKRWDWAMEASVLSNINLVGHGFSGEAIATKSLKNKRFNISVGAGYIQLAQPVNTYRVIEVPGFSSADVVNSGIIYDNADKAVFESLDPSLNLGVYRSNQSLKLHYLSLPVQFSFRCTKRLSIGAGFTNRILIFSKSDYSNGGVVGNLTNANSESISSGATVNKDISVYDFSLNGRVGFNCTPKVSLHLDYQHGITDVLPGNQVGDYNRLIKFGIRYKLSRRH